MTATLDKIVSNYKDYKFCPDCGQINFGENNSCISCEYPLKNTDFATEELILEFKKQELKFWIEEEGYDMEESYNIEYDV